MILIRAPLRISFVGGGTDLPDFYKFYPGRVLSTAIDKFVYLAIKPTPLVNKFIAKYQKTETVAHPRELKNDHIREALLHLGLTKTGIEIGSFADLPAKTGLGSSSSFSVALMKGLSLLKGCELSKHEAAKLACHLEINLLKEPIGKQDQYAAAFGGFNVFQFNKDESVEVEPVFLNKHKIVDLENSLLLFFTGITRPASTVLSEQRQKIGKNMDTYKKMSDSVSIFKKEFLRGNIKRMAEMLNEGWLLKKSLASGVSNSVIDNLFEAGLKAGALGGKILGAGGGGCLFFLAEPSQRVFIKTAMAKEALKNNLLDFQEVPVKFTNSGVDVIFNNGEHV